MQFKIVFLFVTLVCSLGAASAALNNTSRVKRGAKVTSDQKETRQARQETHLISNTPDVVPTGAISRKVGSHFNFHIFIQGNTKKVFHLNSKHKQ